MEEEEEEDGKDDDGETQAEKAKLVDKARKDKHVRTIYQKNLRKKVLQLQNSVIESPVREAQMQLGCWPKRFGFPKNITLRGAVLGLRVIKTSFFFLVGIGDRREISLRRVVVVVVVGWGWGGDGRERERKTTTTSPPPKKNFFGGVVLCNHLIFVRSDVGGGGEEGALLGAPHPDVPVVAVAAAAAVAATAVVGQRGRVVVWEVQHLPAGGGGRKKNKFEHDVGNRGRILKTENWWRELQVPLACML